MQVLLSVMISEALVNWRQFRIGYEWLILKTHRYAKNAKNIIIKYNPALNRSNLLESKVSLLNARYSRLKAVHSF